MKSIFLGSIVALTMMGCAMTSTSRVGPNGKPVHYIDAMSSNSMWEKAGQVCPNGYNTVMGPARTSVMDWEITVECK